MPTTYHGITLPIPQDLADGPKMGQDMVDTLTAGDAYKALDGGNAGPFRLFATTTAGNAWTTPPAGALASVVADDTVYLYKDGAWVKLVPDVPPGITLPAGVVYVFDGTNVVQAGGIGPGTNYLLHNQATGDNLQKNRTGTVMFTCRAWETTAAHPTQVAFKTRLTVGSTVHEQSAGYLSVFHTDALALSMASFTGVTSVKLTVAGVTSVQIFANNTGPNPVAIRDLTVKVMEN